MAGSFNHINTKRGKFTMKLIENMGDAQEALEECHAIITALRSETVDADHAVALEREAICKWLNVHQHIPDDWEESDILTADQWMGLCGDDDCLWWDITCSIAEAIRSGAHNQGSEGEG